MCLSSFWKHKCFPRPVVSLEAGPSGDLRWVQHRMMVVGSWVEEVESISAVAACTLALQIVERVFLESVC